MKACDWAQPGANPYTGSLADALHRYGFDDGTIKAFEYLVERSHFEGIVTITAYGLSSPFHEASNFRDMHWGRDTLCRGEVVRESWHPSKSEIATVYCVDHQCIAIPKVCGNVARIDFKPAGLAEPDIRPQWDGQVNQVPEPGTLALVICFVVALVIKDAITEVIRRVRK